MEKFRFLCPCVKSFCHCCQFYCFIVYFLGRVLSVMQALGIQSSRNIAMILAQSGTAAYSLSSVQDGIYAIGKAHMRSIPSLRSFPNVAFETVPMFVWPSFQGRSSSASSFHASLLRAIGGMMSLALCLQVVSQASQHFWSSEKQATSEGCFASQSICSVVSLHPGVSRVAHPQEFSKVVVDHRRIPIWASHSTFHFL